MKKLLPVLLLTAIVANARTPKWMSKAGTKISDAAKAVKNGTKNTYNKAAKKTTKTYNNIVKDTVFLGSKSSVDTSNGETVVKASNDSNNFSAKLLKAVHSPLDKNQKKNLKKQNWDGIALNCVQGESWENVAKIAKDLVVKAAGSEYVSKALYKKALYKLGKSVKANCGIWSEEADVIAAIRKTDLSFLAKKNAEFLDAKKQ
jgi:hypothetical protein